MDREIGNTDHPSIRDANELLIWFHAEQVFKRVNSEIFPSCESGSCQ